MHRTPFAVPPWRPGRPALIRAIAFDCYGTLIDVDDDSFVRACERVLREQGHEHAATVLWEQWLAASKAAAEAAGRDSEHPTGGPEPEFASFRERWPRVFAGAFKGMGIDADAVAAYEAFHVTLATGKAYPDTVPAIERLAPHYKLAVVSNADDDHLHDALTANKIPIELVLSSETARSYKPRRPIFRQASELLGEHPHDILYVGDSPLMDVLGARYAGMQVAWLNRAGIERPAGVPRPDHEVRDLLELARVLLGDGDGPGG